MVGVNTGKISGPESPFGGVFPVIEVANFRIKNEVSGGRGASMGSQSIKISRLSSLAIWILRLLAMKVHIRLDH